MSLLLQLSINELQSEIRSFNRQLLPLFIGLIRTRPAPDPHPPIIRRGLADADVDGPPTRHHPIREKHYWIQPPAATIPGPASPFRATHTLLPNRVSVASGFLSTRVANVGYVPTHRL